jgi:hypothetical protein
MSWFFDCKVGRVWLRPSGRSHYMLGVDDEPFKAFKSAELAAMAVRDSATGHAALDRLGYLNVPDSLEGWMPESPSDRAPGANATGFNRT